MPAFDSLTTRIPNGVNNAAPWQTMGFAGTPDPAYSHMYHNDFDTFNAADWSITKVGTGVVALTPGDGGILGITNTAGVADSTIMQLANASFFLKPGKASFFRFIGTLSEVLANTSFFGFAQAGATSIATITDGLVITAVAGVAGFSLLSIRAGVTTTKAFPVAATISANTPFELGIAVDAQGNVAAYFNPTTGSNPFSSAAAAAGQSRGRVAALYTYPTGTQAVANAVSSALLAPIVGFTNTTAVVRTMLIDCITVSRER